VARPIPAGRGPPSLAADGCVVDDAPYVDGVWSYARQQERLRIERRDHAQSVELVFTGTAGLAYKRFADLDSLLVYHALFERALLETGWTFEGYTPERRASTDRRSDERGVDRRGVGQRLVDRVGSDP